MNTERSLIKSFLLEEKGRIATYADLMDVSNKSVYLLINSDAPIKPSMVIAVCSMFQVTPEKLGFDMQNPKWRAIQDRLLKKYDTSKGNNLVSFRRWKETSLEEDRNYSETYFDAVLEKVKKEENEIFIYDYYTDEKLITQAKREQYFKGYKRYTEELEAHLIQLTKRQKEQGERPISYTRIVSIPQCLASKLTNLGGEALIKATIRMMFPGTFKHILKMLELHDKGEVDFKLQITGVGSRNMSYMLLTDWILSELYRKKRDGTWVPSELYMQSTKTCATAHQLKQLLKDEFLEIEQKELGVRVFNLDYNGFRYYSELIRLEDNANRLSPEARAKKTFESQPNTNRSFISSPFDSRFELAL